MGSARDSYLERAIELAVLNVRNGGGPFAALVVKDGAIIGEGVNMVIRTNDPTAHAEVVAIRAACRELGHHQLDGCDLYSSCEPCPMCLGAIYWARPARLYYAATADDAAGAGFDDSYIYRQISTPHTGRAIPMIVVPVPGALAPFDEWRAKADRRPY